MGYKTGWESERGVCISINVQAGGYVCTYVRIIRVCAVYVGMYIYPESSIITG